MTVRRLRPLVACLLAATSSLLSGCGSSGEGRGSSAAYGDARTLITVPLGEENGSQSSGTATVRAGRRGFVVALAVTPAARYHAHIHDVSCAVYRELHDFYAQLDTVAVTLTDLRDGRSTSSVHARLAKYAKHGFSINVHQYAPPYPVVACGDLAVR